MGSGLTTGEPAQLAHLCKPALLLLLPLPLLLLLLLLLLLIVWLTCCCESVDVFALCLNVFKYSKLNPGTLPRSLRRVYCLSTVIAVTRRKNGASCSLTTYDL
jgi:hypothetical protein